MKKKKECEDRLDLVVAVMKDFDITIKWTQYWLVAILLHKILLNCIA